MAKQPKSSGTPWGAGKKWYSRTDDIEFLRGGGLYGVTLTLKTEFAKKLQNDLRNSLSNAKKFKLGQVEVIVHWGKKGKDGYLLETKAKG